MSIFILILVSIPVSLFLISILVIVHEFGHFIVAKKSGIPVLEFAIGLPFTPKIWGKTVGETTYSVYPILFGGFVKLLGENEEEENSKFSVSQQFVNKSKLIRSLVVMAGVIMNFLLAIVAFGIVYSFSGIPKDTHKLKVVDISTDSPAKTAGLVVGDIIVKVNKAEISSVDGFISKVNDQKGKNTTFEINRNGSVLKLQIKPRENSPKGEGSLGVTITTTEVYHPPVWQIPFYAAYYGTKDSLAWVTNVWQGLSGIAQDASHGKVSQGVSGPFGIFAIIYTILKTGDILILINLIGILSVNLAVLNILPFPALDGGRLFFIMVEVVIRRKISPKLESTIHGIGMIILLALMIAITFKDIKGFISAGSISGFLNSLGK